jgi:hypothetical protein
MGYKYVKDRKPLAFASVIADNGTKTITDVDGKLLQTVKHSSFLSYIGF